MQGVGERRLDNPEELAGELVVMGETGDSVRRSNRK